MMDNETSEKKPHSKLGIASLVASLLATLIHFLNISEMFDPNPWGGRPCATPCPEEFKLWYLIEDIEQTLIFGLAIIGFVIGIISLRDKTKNRQFGFIGIVINSFWVLMLIALLVFPL